MESSQHKQRRALVTNDDGIDSFFLRVLVDALLEKGFDVIVAAPAREQSWIGRAMSRYRSVEVTEYPDLPCPAWKIDGTPADCVNIALEHLCSDHIPDVVLSGINVGYNCSMPLILCSGTVAGATEGAVWGLRSIALSQAVPNQMFDKVKGQHHTVPEELEPHLRRAATHGATFALDLLQQPPERLVVHNLNYPFPIEEETETRRTVPADMTFPGFFKEASPGVQRFIYQPGKPRESTVPTDRDTILSGQISHSILNWLNVATVPGNKNSLPSDVEA